MKICVLIGGGEIGKGKTSYETKEIDEEIVKLAKKENPNFLFIGLASSFSDSYYDTIKKIYKKLGCTTVYLKKNNLIHNPKLVEEKIKNADIIYIGGGDTIKLLESIKTYNLEPQLKEAYERGCIMAGISAGAILLSKEGFSDSKILRGESTEHEFIKGLNLINISISPHHHTNNQKTKELEEAIQSTKKKVYGIENKTALKIEDNTISTIHTDKDYNAYLCFYDKKYQEKIID